MPNINLLILITPIFNIIALNIGLIVKKIIINYIVLKHLYFTVNSLADSMLNRSLSINIDFIKPYYIKSINIY